MKVTCALVVVTCCLACHVTAELIATLHALHQNDAFHLLTIKEQVMVMMIMMMMMMMMIRKRRRTRTKWEGG
jgi:hypothetical protein